MKLQDYFKNQDGSDVLDSPQKFKILSINEKRKDDKWKKNVVELEHDTTGEACFWELDDPTLKRIFTSKNDDGEVYWEAKNGDLVEIGKFRPKGDGKFPYFAATPFKDDESTPPAVKTANPQPVEEVKAPGTTNDRPTGNAKWWGTPRQQAFKNGLCTIVSGLVSNPNFDHKNDESCLEVMKAAEDFWIECCKRGDVLEKSYPNV